MHVRNLMLTADNYREIEMFAHLRGITSIAQLSRFNAKVNNLWVSDDVGVALCTVELINP